MADPKGVLADFRIGVPHERASWRVLVFDTLAQLRDAGSKLGPSGFGRKAYAACIHYRNGFVVDVWGNHKPKLKGELGVILLCRRHIDERVVSHECCHAMLYTAALCAPVITFDGPRWKETDEKLAWMLGEYVRQIYAKLRKEKLVQ